MAKLATRTIAEDENDEADTGTSHSAANNGDSGLAPVTMPAIHRPNQANDAEEFEIVETDDNGEALNGATEAGLSTEEQTGDTYLDAQAQQAQDEEDRKNNLSRSTRRRRGQKARAREAENEAAQLRRQLAEVQARLSGYDERFQTIEPRMVELGAARLRDEQTRVSEQLRQATEARATAQNAFLDAIESGDRAAMATAMDKRDQAVIQVERLNVAKQRIDAAAQQVSDKTPRTERAPADNNGGREIAFERNDAAPKPRPLDQRAKQNLDDFVSRHSWFRPSQAPGQNDLDTDTVLLLDQKVATEGYDPATPAYWDRLEDLMEERMPHVFSEDETRAAPANGKTNGQQARPQAAQNGNGAPRQPPAPARRGPMTAGSGARANGNGGAKNQVRISPERKSAMIQAGAIDDGGRVVDQAKFNRLLKSYSEYDRANGAARP